MHLFRANHPARSPAVAGLVIIALLAVLLPGCTSTVTPTIGGGVATYELGALDATLAVEFNQAVEAARRALKELEFAKVSDNKDAYAAVLVDRTALGKKVVVTVTNSGKNLTNIKIRVALVGDQQLSLAILEKIRAGL